MNIKKATNSQLSIAESKKQTKQAEPKQNHMEIIWRVNQLGGGSGIMEKRYRD